MKVDPLSGLDDEQRQAVTAPLGPVCVLAGAGTGKTRTITHRIAQLVATGAVSTDEVLAVTFTTRAAGELRLRLRALGAPGVQARTFHAAALKQLQYFWPKATGQRLNPLLESRFRILHPAVRAHGLVADSATMRDIGGEIDWAKASLIGPDRYVAEVARRKRDTPLDPQRIAEIYAGYESAKDDAELVDFDDLLLSIAGVLENDDRLAAEFRARYRCFVVDEYQDVTPLQQRVLDAWLGGRDQLTVVGDANQTIYSFAGASPRQLLNFDTKYPHALVVKLERDYRSTPQVVELANRAIAGARGTASRFRLRLRSVLADGPAPTFTEYPDEQAEATAIAQRCRVLLDAGMPPSEIAVLYRINAQSEVFEQAMTAAEVPYLVRGGQRFYARPEIRRALTTLRSAADRLRSPEELGSTRMPALVPLVRKILETVGLSATPPRGGALLEQWESLSALVSLAEDFADADPAAGLPAFVSELMQRAEAQDAPTSAGITLASLHAAKGLEWTAVFLVGLTDGTLPIQYADTPEAVEEERRLFYVGITRAKQQLALSWAKSRNDGGGRPRNRSRFLAGIAPDAAPPVDRTRRGPGRCRGCAGQLVTPAEIKLGRCENCPSSADPGLLAELQDWRRLTAAARSVPPFVVFSDLTLQAIAEARPSAPRDLLRISGVGPGKLDDYGPAVLQIIARHQGN